MRRPAWVRAVATAIATGGTQAEERFEGDGEPEIREPRRPWRAPGSPGNEVPAPTMAACRDDGGVTVVAAGGFDLVVVRHVGAAVESGQLLRATWEGGRDVVLAGLRTGVGRCAPP